MRILGGLGMILALAGCDPVPARQAEEPPVAPAPLALDGPGPDPARFPVPAGRAPTPTEAKLLAQLRAGDRYGSLFQLGGVGIAGDQGDQETIARALATDPALLRTMLGDPSPVVRAYAGFFLVEGGEDAVAALERSLADEARMYAQHGCQPTIVQVWEEIGALFSSWGRPWPAEVFEAVAARGVAPSAARAAQFIAYRRTWDARQEEVRAEAARWREEHPEAAAARPGGECSPRWPYDSLPE